MKVQLATRLDTGLRQRLRIYAAVTGRTVEDVVSTALEGYLPPTADMVRDTAAGPAKTLSSRNNRWWRDDDRA
jgi:plasmid stability protein